MPRTITEITVFIASPSDVSHERDVVAAAIAEWNARHGRDRSIVFELIRWETAVSAGFGSDGQDVINTQVNDKYDVLIAIFWARFGSYTPRAPSGTVEEYHRALNRLRETNDVDIAMLFKDVPIDFRVVDLNQLSQLKDFEKEVRDSGALTKSFKDDDGLKLEIGMILDRLARSLSVSESIRISKMNSITEINGLEAKQQIFVQTEVFDEEDIGLFDIVERLQEHAAIAGSFLDRLTAALTTMSQITDEVATEFQAIRDVRPLEPVDTKPGVQKVADSMNAFSQFLEDEISSYAENFNALGNDTRDIIRVSYDWIETGEDMVDHLSTFRSMLSTMYGAVGENQTSLLDMIQTTSKLQRTTSTFNKAKRRLIHNASGLIEVNESCRAIIALAIDELGRLTLAAEQHENR